MKIEEHSLFIRALEKLRPLIESTPVEDLMIESSEERHAKAPTLSAEQTYHHHVFWYAMNMQKAFSRLSHTTVYVKDFPRPGSYLRHGVTQYDWVQYHYHVYMISIVGLYDIALKLTNTVLQLGVDEKQVNKSTVEDNLWAKQFRVSESLRNFRQTASHVKLPRNLFLHGGDLLKLDELDKLDIICIANRLGHDYPADAIKSQFKPAIDKLVGKMSNEISSLESQVINLFDKLLPIYDHHASTFETAGQHKKP